MSLYSRKHTVAVCDGTAEHRAFLPHGISNDDDDAYDDTEGDDQICWQYDVLPPHLCPRIIEQTLDQSQGDNVNDILFLSQLLVIN